MKSYALIIDHESCWGCKTCEVACKQEISSPEGVQLIKVLEDGPRIIEGKPELTFRVNTCQHCDEPACADVCPEDAIFKRDDTIVILDGEKCIGCGLCIDACPYDAIAFDSEKGVAQKCNLCFHRVDNGLIPACADNVCPGHCVYFGDPDVIQREIAEKHSRRSKGTLAATEA
jgi:Fe-S-cluster-containing dehydrogenase component